MLFDLSSVLPAGTCNADDPASTGATADCEHSKDFVLLLAYNGNFCEEFPSLCTPPSTQTLTKLEQVETIICSTSSTARDTVCESKDGTTTGEMKIKSAEAVCANVATLPAEIAT